MRGTLVDIVARRGHFEVRGEGTRGGALGSRRVARRWGEGGAGASGALSGTPLFIGTPPQLVVPHHRVPPLPSPTHLHPSHPSLPPTQVVLRYPSDAKEVSWQNGQPVQRPYRGPPCLRLEQDFPDDFHVRLAATAWAKAHFEVLHATPAVDEAWLTEAAAAAVAAAAAAAELAAAPAAPLALPVPALLQQQLGLAAEEGEPVAALLADAAALAGEAAGDVGHLAGGLQAEPLALAAAAVVAAGADPAHLAVLHHMHHLQQLPAAAAHEQLPAAAPSNPGAAAAAAGQPAGETAAALPPPPLCPSPSGELSLDGQLAAD